MLTPRPLMIMTFAREREIIGPGYGGIQHPTSRIFDIGVDSIRAGKPSELFLVLLESIGKMAEERDVMAELFPETFRRRIKTSTVRAAQREAAIVEKFQGTHPTIPVTGS